ncbi:TPA: HNH endonuclease [Klebsiella pneumoniae]|uniref:HNH endonuclease n=1 Tax=Klebsiella variicola TaxID=244366 RepID=UPI000D74241C|nr:HNH endonuclease [Klebsiella variicola]PXK26400.1 hypothetical protein DMR83_00475 [Klebsiella variicola]HBY0307530.1 hypothetical protein [Klebsiella pneumoniae subsp. pneumoniae]HED3827032.1 HNH endonuclease [Klebsiella pneumoniae]
MFYPILTRREKYDQTKSGAFYRYAYYRKVIEEDCQNRCVYCDLLLKEHAFEGMHLDHFRPQSFFKELTNDPRNLVLACPKCNYLKTNHWPCNVVSIDSPSHNGMVGFIDPFSEHMREYFNIDKHGIIKANKKPADYLIELLKLNRPAKVMLRRRRLQINTAIKMKEIMDKQIESLFYQLAKEGCNKTLILDKYKKLKRVNEILNEVLCQE